MIMRIRLVAIAAAILCSAGCSRQTEGASGYMVDIVSVAKEKSIDCNVYLIFAIATPNHKARLNSEHFNTFSAAAVRLHEVLATRAERAVFVKAEPGVAWGEFIEMLDHLKPEVQRLGIITPQVEALSHDDNCIIWPVRTRP
jgi:hypothetical protein